MEGVAAPDQFASSSTITANAGGSSTAAYAAIGGYRVRDASTGARSEPGGRYAADNGTGIATGYRSSRSDAGSSYRPVRDAGTGQGAGAGSAVSGRGG